jgi:hypothetical protein
VLVLPAPLEPLCAIATVAPSAAAAMPEKTSLLFIQDLLHCSSKQTELTHLSSYSRALRLCYGALGREILASTKTS